MSRQVFLANGLMFVVFGLGVSACVNAQQGDSPRPERSPAQGLIDLQGGLSRDPKLDNSPPASIKELIDLLDPKNPNDQTFAARELAQRGSAARDSVPALLHMLEQRNTDVQCGALFAIGTIASDDKSLLPAIEKRIGDKDPWVRAAACNTAWLIGRSPKAIPAIIALLDNPDHNIRGFAALVVEGMGKSAASAAPKLADRLSEPNEGVAVYVGRALMKMGTAALEPLLEKSHSPNARVRELAIAFLGDMKVADRRIADAILAAMDDPVWEVRYSAIGAVRESKIWGPLVTEKLVKLLNDNEDMVREEAAKALGETGATRAIPALEKAMENRSTYLREAIAYALGNLHAVQAIPALERAMEDEKAMQEEDFARGSSVRVAIVNALGCMGPAAISAIEKARNDSDCRVREAAADLLQRISSEIQSKSSLKATAGGCKKCRLRRCRLPT